MSLPKVGGGTIVGSTIPNDVSFYATDGPASLTTSALLTVQQLSTFRLISDQGAGAAASYQLPLAATMDEYFVNMFPGSAFVFTLTNVGNDASEDATITTNTGWTLVGSMVVQDNATVTNRSAGAFEARKVDAGQWVLTRIS